MGLRRGSLLHGLATRLSPLQLYYEDLSPLALAGIFSTMFLLRHSIQRVDYGCTIPERDIDAMWLAARHHSI